MLGWLLLGALMAAAVITICVTFLNEKIAKNKLKEKGIKKGVIKDIINSNGVAHIKLDAIDENGTEQQVEFEANDYDASEIRMGMTIVA